MTALNQYSRLESTAIWRPEINAQRRDVFISLGDATLVIHDGKEIALAHWSLPAVTRLNPGLRPARYAPGPDSPEELEIGDETMIEAIERVRTVVDRSRPKSGRLRVLVISGCLLAALLFAIVWVPGALVRQTASIVPEASRAAIGDEIMVHLRPLVGAACRTRTGDLALARLKNRLLPDNAHGLAVVPSGITGAAHLPGGTILIGRAAVEDFEAPEVVAGFVLAEAAVFSANDPLVDVLEQAGFGATLQLLTQGDLPRDALSDYARTIVAKGWGSVPDVDLIRGHFEDAGVPMTPYAFALDVTGETVLPLIEADTAVRTNERPILSDDDWVSLQNICGA